MLLVYLSIIFVAGGVIFNSTQIKKLSHRIRKIEENSKK